MKYIRRFLQENYSDEQLAALLAHTESGKLSYSSCCCLIGIPSAGHALLGAGEYCGNAGIALHLVICRTIVPFAAEAEEEFDWLGGEYSSDATRRELLLPVIREEMKRRDMERQLAREIEEQSVTV